MFSLNDGNSLWACCQLQHQTCFWRHHFSHEHTKVRNAGMAPPKPQQCHHPSRPGVCTWIWVLSSARSTLFDKHICSCLVCTVHLRGLSWRRKTRTHIWGTGGNPLLGPDLGFPEDITFIEDQTRVFNGGLKLTHLTPPLHACLPTLPNPTLNPVVLIQSCWIGSDV